MIELRSVSAVAKDFEKIKQLYESAFPNKERLPIFDLLENRNETTFCAVYDNELFCGFFCFGSILKLRKILLCCRLLNIYNIWIRSGICQAHAMAAIIKKVSLSSHHTMICITGD